MTTEHFGELSHHVREDDRPSGIPRPGHLGVAKTELLLALIALFTLVLLACAFYLSSR
jgi:hypothetical protein